MTDTPAPRLTQEQLSDIRCATCDGFVSMFTWSHGGKLCNTCQMASQRVAAIAVGAVGEYAERILALERELAQAHDGAADLNVLIADLRKELAQAREELEETQKAMISNLGNAGRCEHALRICTAERDNAIRILQGIRKQAEDATEYVLAQLLRETRAQLAAVTLDAQRYRWLKANHLQTGPDSWIRTGDDLEEAIDAALAAVAAGSKT